MAAGFHVGEEGREQFALKDKEQDVIISKLEDIGMLGSKVLIYVHAA